MDILYDALKERYPAPEYALFFEVANGVGAHHRRYADAMAMSLFPSRGLDLHGFEVKTDRGDWRRELKDPEKADEIAAYCDYWWVVLPNLEIVKLEEVPRPWGVLVLQEDGKTLRQVKKATELDAKPLDRAFVACILRRAHESMGRAATKRKAVESAYQKGIKEGEGRAQADLAVARGELRNFEASVKRFEEASGLQINAWNGGDLGKSVDLVRQLRHDTPAEQLEQLASHLDSAAAEFRRRIETVKSVKEGV
jgi:hypothetical protein